MFSRNSASSRAVPFEKMLEKVQNDPFIPIKWMKDHAGMQGNEYFNEEESNLHEANWLMARDQAVQSAKVMSNFGVTKQIVNRLLEPFQWHVVLITSTEWENFFALRCHEAAEIHIQEFAYKALEAMNNSIPKQLKAGEWHIPFGDAFDKDRIEALYDEYRLDDNGLTHHDPVAEIKIATARCARVSYINYEGKDDYEADLKLYDRLSGMGHWSPFEHCAKAMGQDDLSEFLTGFCGNFEGFIQLRKTFSTENKKDNRLKKEYATKA